MSESRAQGSNLSEAHTGTTRSRSKSGMGRGPFKTGSW